MEGVEIVGPNEDPVTIVQVGDVLSEVVEVLSVSKEEDISGIRDGGGRHVFDSAASLGVAVGDCLGYAWCTEGDELNLGQGEGFAEFSECFVFIAVEFTTSEYVDAPGVVQRSLDLSW